jgi:hypothetical protein
LDILAKTDSIEPKAHTKARRKATNVMPPANGNIETFPRCENAFHIRSLVKGRKAFIEILIAVRALCLVKIDLACVAHVYAIFVYAAWIQMRCFFGRVESDVFVTYCLCKYVVVRIGM